MLFGALSSFACPRVAGIWNESTALTPLKDFVDATTGALDVVITINQFLA
jgi:hypothetical protein